MNNDIEQTTPAPVVEPTNITPASEAAPAIEAPPPPPQPTLTERGTVVIDGREFVLQEKPEVTGVTSDGHCKLLAGDGPVVHPDADLPDANGLVRNTSVKVIDDPYRCGTCGVVRERYEFVDGQCAIAVKQGKADPATPATRVFPGEPINGEAGD